MKRLFVGGENSIRGYEWKEDSLVEISKTEIGEVPSFLAFAESEARVFAIAEGSDALVSLARRGESLLPVSRVPCGGGPAYVSLDETRRLVFTASYGSGEVRAYRYDDQGKLELLSEVFAGKHAHSIQALRSRNSVLVACLGSDTLLDYTLEDGKLVDPKVVAFPEGTGPRHFAATRDECRLFVVGELDVSLSELRFESGAWKVKRAIELLEDRTPGSDSGADIHLSNGEKYALVSTRGTDRIVMIELDSWSVRQRTPLPGRFPRHFALARDGRLTVGLQESREVAFGSFDETSGKISIGESLSVPEKAFFVALEET